MKIKMIIENFQVIKKGEVENLFKEKCEKLSEDANLNPEEAKKLLFCNMLSEFDPEIMDAELKFKNSQTYYKVKIDKEDYEQWVNDSYEEIVELLTPNYENEDNMEDNEIKENEDNMEDNEIKENHEEVTEENKEDNIEKQSIIKEEIIIDAEKNSEILNKEIFFSTLKEWIEFKKSHGISTYIPERLFAENKLKIKFVASNDGF